MSGPPEWPDGRRAALCLTFDNLGEAAEAQLGAAPLPDGRGDHFTATRVLPGLLDELGSRGLSATFFVEGVNAELYPDALRRVVGEGHEVGYHAWCHEDWASLTAAEQAANLRRGIAAFRALGLDPVGLRPPGGLLGDGGVGVLAEAGLRYASPAGSGAGSEDGVALLPFDWRHVDAASVLPGLEPVRERMSSSPRPLEPAAFLACLERSLDDLTGDGGYLAIVLHLAMLDWLGEARLGTLLDRVATASEASELWLAPCAEAAAHVLSRADAFRGGARLDSASWTRSG
jgi:peptidoglycan/xylan/chitin deacetylase (PgdA/CDA1 family)